MPWHLHGYSHGDHDSHASRDATPDRYPSQKGEALKYLILFLMLLAPRAHASIALSALATPVSTGTQNLTVSITTGSGSNRIGIAVVDTVRVNNYNPATGVTWGGNAMTLVSRRQAAAGTLYETVEVWKYLNPAASTSTSVIATLTVAGDQNNLGAAEYSGVDQSTPFGAIADVSGTAQTLSQTVTTTYANSWILTNVGWYASNSAITKDAALNLRWDTHFTPVGQDEFFGDRTTTSAGNYTVTNTFSLALSIVCMQLLELVETQATPTPTITPTYTPTATPTFTATPTASPTSTITPTFTNTATPSATPTRTNTPVASATPTTTPTATQTPVCSNYGNTTSTGSYYAGNGTIFYKKITVGAQAQIQNIYVYVKQGTGQIKGAIYDTVNGNPYNLLAQSAPAYASQGWQSVSITSGSLTAGTYWVAMECSGSIKMVYSPVGQDKYQYSQFGPWPNPATRQNWLGNSSIYSFKCE